MIFNHGLSPAYAKAMAGRRTTRINVRVGRARTPAAPHIATPGRACAPRTPHWLVAVCTFFALVLTAFAADPGITVSARQRYPWNGLVDLHFTITGTAGTKYDTSFTAKDMVGNTNIAMRTIRKSDGTAAAATEQLIPGTYNWVWDAAADLSKDWKCDRVTVTGTANEFKPLYMVIDLSGGANASSYPVSYLDAVPSGGWSDTYKTTKLVLRRIEPGTFKMCGQYNVKLTKAFYIGVFEVTQRQYTLIMGTNPSDYKGDKRPVEQVSWEMIRGNATTYNWPNVKTVGSDSFAGRISKRTGKSFDLPTEAQWEYACRAGTTSLYNNGGNTENDLKKVGRYSGNTSDGKGGYSQHTVVGSYASNAWGLYDMHGNNWEWCLDWFGDLTSNVTDPKGPTSGGWRIFRGGSWYYYGADACQNTYRYNRVPSSFSNYYYGFRICMTIQ